MTPTPQKSSGLVPVSGRRIQGLTGYGKNIPALFSASAGAGKRFWEFFTAHIRNRNTRRAYFRSVAQFSGWCEKRNLSLEHVQPIHVAGYIEQLSGTHAKPTVKQHLAAIRMLFDWLVTGQIIPVNPAHSVRGPRHSVKKGKTSVLSPDEMRILLDSIDTTKLIGLRDRALIAVMGYTFARVGAVRGVSLPATLDGVIHQLQAVTREILGSIGQADVLRVTDIESFGAFWIPGRLCCLGIAQ